MMRLRWEPPRVVNALAARFELRPQPLDLRDRTGGPDLCCVVLVAILERPRDVDAIAEEAVRKEVVNALA